MTERFGSKRWSVLIIFGLLGQIAWSVENMFFNTFVYNDIAPNLDTVSLMVQLSGITATVVTLVAGVLSDKLGDRRRFISIGYIIWGITVVLFGCISEELVGSIFGISGEAAVRWALIIAVVGDCVMTFFGSTANDAAFNAWVTDNTKRSFRGTVEGVLSTLPLIAMLIVAGGFGILRDLVGGYPNLFFILGVLISLSGVLGIFMIKEAPSLERCGGMKDIFFGFTPSVIKKYVPFYLTLLVVLVYSVASQVFMPYIMIYMEKSLGFSAIEYSLSFGGAILLGAILNVFLGRLSDRYDKSKLLYIAAGVMTAGLLVMFFVKGENHYLNLALFSLGGFVMISGYVFVLLLTGSLLRDYTPVGASGKMQGVRMTASVLLPMLIGPVIGNAVNRTFGGDLKAPGDAILTTKYLPAPEMFLFAALIMLLSFALIPVLSHFVKRAPAVTDAE